MHTSYKWFISVNILIVVSSKVFAQKAEKLLNEKNLVCCNYTKRKQSRKRRLQTGNFHHECLSVGVTQKQFQHPWITACAFHEWVRTDSALKKQNWEKCLSVCSSVCFYLYTAQWGSETQPARCLTPLYWWRLQSRTEPYLDDRTAFSIEPAGEGTYRINTAAVTSLALNLPFHKSQS